MIIFLQAMYLKLLMPDDRNRADIERHMALTFEERRKLANDPRCAVKLLIEAFPKLVDFGGRMVCIQSFKMVSLIFREKV